MEDKITLDRETFKALAVDTRIEILKRLNEHKETLTDLAQEMNMSPSTIKEHLDKLVSVGLIEQIEKDTKWKYYRLTSKGKAIVSPYETKIWILLGISIIGFIGMTYSFLTKLIYLPSGAATLTSETVLADSVPKVLESTPEMAQQIPYIEFLLVIIFAIVIGLCIGYLVKKRI